MKSLHKGIQKRKRQGEIRKNNERMSSVDTEEGGKHERHSRRRTNMFLHIFREIICKDSKTTKRNQEEIKHIQCIFSQKYENSRNQSVKRQTQKKILTFVQNTYLKLLKKINFIPHPKQPQDCVYHY